jgi:hypothetical protein
MNLKCFVLLSQYLHFVHNETTDGTDRLVKVRYVLDYVNWKFSSLYTPEQDIATYEG